MGKMGNTFWWYVDPENRTSLEVCGFSYVVLATGDDGGVYLLDWHEYYRRVLH